MLPWLSVLVLTTSWSCSKDEKDPTKPAAEAPVTQKKADDLKKVLGQIPAETPYAFVSIEPMPEKILDKILKIFEPVRLELEKEIAAELKGQAPTDDPEEKIARAVAEEFSGKISKAGFAELGISTTPSWALYGVGLMPVFRVSLADPSKFKAMIGRIETKAGQKAPVKKVGDQEYWSMSEDGMTMVAALIGSDLVLAMTPNSLAARTLPIVFGHQKPGKSLASAGTIDTLRKTHGYKAVGIGFVSLTGIADVFLGKSGGLNAETVTAMGGALPPLSPVCKSEIGAMVAKAPHLSFGYTEVTDSKWVSKANLALDKGIATDLKGIVGPVAGLEDGSPAFVKFGIGLDLKKTIAYARKQLAAMAANPFKCELMGELNQGIMEGNANFGAFAAQLPPFLMGVKGANLVVKDADFASNDPTKVKGHVILSVDQPAQMVTMLKAMVPPLATLNVPADGKPVKLTLPPGQLPPGIDPYIAMGEAGLGIAVGKGEEAAMAKLVKAKGSSETFLAVGYDVGRFMKTVNEQMGAMRAMLPPGSATDDHGDALTKAISEVFGFTYSEVKFTDKGVDFTQSIWLK
jgi:hypothetical protein